MVKQIKVRLRALFRRTKLERDMDEELRYHVQKEVDRNISSGMSPHEARYEALRQFGGIEQAKEQCRDAGGVRWIDDLWQDLRFAVRTMWRTPAITAVAIIALTLGIGGASAIFSVVNAVLLRPLPYFQADRIMHLWSTLAPGNDRTSPSFPRYTVTGGGAKTFEQIGAYCDDTVTLTGAGEPLRLSAVRMSTAVLEVLRVKPAIGRNFLAEEDKRGGPAVAIISDGLWRRLFGTDPRMIGRSINLDGASWTVVGIMPPNADFLGLKADIWLPRAFEPSFYTARQVESGSGYLYMIGRLKPGVTLQQAQSELNAIAQRDKLTGRADASYGIAAVSLPEEVIGNIQPTLLVLLGAVAFVLLIACANVANLLLTRALGRQKEISIRAALGARRGRLIRQFLAESMLLALIASGLGFLLTSWSVSGLAALAADNLPRAAEINVDWRVLGFTIAVAFLTGLIFGLAPALQASKADLNGALKDSSRGSTGGLRRARLRSALVIAEVALSVVLLIGAGLLIKSFARLTSVDTGFQVSNLLVARLSLPPTKYASSIQQSAFYNSLLSDLATLPGIKSVGAVDYLPLAGGSDLTAFAIDGRPLPPFNERPHVTDVTATASYFKTMGIPVQQGRLWDERDRADAPPTLIINQSFRRRYFPDEDPIGRHILIGKTKQYEIIGVVGDVRQLRLSAAPTEAIYFSATQTPALAMSIVLRTAGPPVGQEAAVRSRVLALDKDQPVASFQTMEEVVAARVSDRRFTLILIGAFALIALLLATIGIYSVMAYTVTQRTAEIGLRMALGAQAYNVLKLVVGQGLTMVLIGLAFGLVGALGLTRVLASMLFDVSVTDPLTFVSIPALLAAVALAACFVPARRATKIDPIVALRHD